MFISCTSTTLPSPPPFAMITMQPNKICKKIVFNVHDNHLAEFKNPTRLIFVCCQAETEAAREYNFKLGMRYSDGFSRLVPRYNDSDNGHDCNIPMSAGGWARQSFLERIQEEINGTGGRYIVSQLARCHGDDQEIWNIEIDSMLQGEDRVSDATKLRFALQDKAKLYQILTRLGFSAYVPKQYEFPEVLPLPGQYPVIVKRIQGAWGQGVHIIKSEAELNRIMLQDHGHLQVNDMTKQAGVDYVVQEALVNTTEHVLHYVRTPKGFPGHVWTKVWCGIYSHPDWVDKRGLFIKGTVFKDNSPNLRRTQCDNRVVQVALAVMKDVGVSGFGCLSYKYVETTTKIFDYHNGEMLKS